MSHTYNNKNTPGGRRRLPVPVHMSDALAPRPTNVQVNRNDYQEQRRQSIAQLRVAERLVEEQQAVEIGITDDNKELPSE